MISHMPKRVRAESGATSITVTIGMQRHSYFGTRKDPAAAKHVGLSLQDYVIGGMDAEFREQLYHAGRAMDAAGLSAFRDDYRQGLASGYKAGVSNSLHGGSRRTGGYGQGRAIDITGPEGKESDVWKWIDDHGAKYGLHRASQGRSRACTAAW